MVVVKVKQISYLSNEKKTDKPRVIHKEKSNMM
jgi:hypothetical protein